MKEARQCLFFLLPKAQFAYLRHFAGDCSKACFFDFEKFPAVEFYVEQ